MATATRIHYVSNAELRAHAEHHDLAVIALRMGWLTGGSPDTHRLKRALGITKAHVEGKAQFQTEVTEETAAQICRAMDLLPREVGL